jgi:hypothetical protein
MSVFKSQFSRALSVIRTDNAIIPYPNVAKQGTNTDVGSEQSLVDSSGFFLDKNIAVGDVVYNNTNGSAATVTDVYSQTILYLNADIFLTEDQSYVIYQASSKNTNGNPGCNLYVGSVGSLTVTTIGGDIVTFQEVPAGTILPVQVIKAWEASSASNVVALW